MEKRPFDYARDIECIVAMQQRSFEINFPGELFYEPAFRDSLRHLGRDEVVWVYEDGDQIVGWVWLDLGQGRRRIHVRQLQVLEERWGQGIGRHIMEEAIALCRELERTELTLNVTKSNARAMALYRSLGFQKVTDWGERQFMRLVVPEAVPKSSR